jgi:mRNA interferase RelE/StbE
LAWTIEYTESALRQLKKLDRPVALKVFQFMQERISLLDDPRSAGKNLVGPKLGSYWRYRVGDVRVICHINDGQLLILVIDVGHRKEVYR